MAENHSEIQTRVQNDMRTIVHITEPLYTLLLHTPRCRYRLRTKSRCIYPVLHTYWALHPIWTTPHLLQSPKANTHQHTAVTCAHIQQTHAQWNGDAFPPQADVHWTRPNILRDSFPSIPHSTHPMCRFTRLEPLPSPPKTCNRLHVHSHITYQSWLLLISTL